MGSAHLKPSCTLARQRRDKMSFILKMLPHNLPAFIREEILTELFRATADAFQCTAPAFDHLSFEDCLQAYAFFTREQAEKALQSGSNIPALKTHLYRNAYPLGAKLRQWFTVDTMEDVMELGQILYQAIGVEIVGDTRDDVQGYSLGSVTVKRCYFSQFYSAPVCDLISALDDGVLSGLSGGGRLSFSERITEGRQFCKAKLSSREEGIT